MTPRGRKDEGAALVLALAFVTIVSIGTTALITLADTGQRTTQAIRAQGHEIYSASGAVDRAIDDVRNNPAWGRHSGPCPDRTTELNGVATVVTCTGAVGSGGSAGGGANSNNTPPNAVLTLAMSEPGLVQESNNELKIAGPVTSNSNVHVNVATASLDVDGPVKARGACSAQVTSDPAPSCSLGATATIADSTDPNYAMHPDAPAGSPPAAAPPPAGCTAGTPKLVVFEPGTYNSVTDLNNVFSTCAGSVFWFKPGFYYFDFTDSTAAWEITGSPSTRVVGGERIRWLPAAPAAGDPAPFVPFPTDLIPGVPPLPDTPAVPGGCVTADESSSTPGVQWAFGGTSRLYVEDAKVELCARGSSTQQQIAVYGLPAAKDTTTAPPQAPTQQTEPYTFTGPATTTTTDPAFTDPDGARVTGGTYARALATQGSNGSTGTLSVPGLTGNAIPAGATVDGLNLRIRHHPLNNNVTAVNARLLRANGTTITTFPSVGGNCTAASTDGICTKGTSAWYDQVVQVTGPFNAADLAGARLELHATVKKGNTQNPDGEERVDALSVDVLYTPAATVAPTPYRQLSGCHASTLESGGCPLLQTVGGPTALSVHGTFYAPSGALRLELTNVSGQVLERGVIARTVRVAVTGSSTFSGSPIRLPTLSGAPGNREVIFLARQGSRLVLRAVVRFDDNALLSPDRRADVLSWSVLR